MKEQTIKEFVHELRKIKNRLMETEDLAESEAYLRRVTEIVVLLRGKDSAEQMRTHIMHYYMNCIDKAELLNHLEEFIELLKKEAEANGESVDEPTVSGICAEVKDVCANVLGVFCKEAGTAYKDIGRTIKEGTPNCVSTIQYLKEAPKRAEKALKGKLRNWLMSD